MKIAPILPSNTLPTSASSIPENIRAFFTRLGNEVLAHLRQTPTTCKYRKVFADTASREAFRAFLNRIFLRLDDNKFFALIDTILSNSSLDTDEKIYAALKENIGTASKGFFGTFLTGLRSLRELQYDLATQVADLMGSHNKVKGYVEIGYPGRMIRPIQGKLAISGTATVVNDSQSLSDYVQCGFPRPYQRFVPLDNYRPIPESEIPSQSVDLVTCFIGLHHAPEEQLEAFVESLNRILRPGGSFILMDHDANTQQLQDLVWVVHSVFNAATGVSIPEDEKEVRRFAALEKWKNLLERHGFEALPSTYMREGDPTKNMTIRFVKKLTTPEDISYYLSCEEGYTRAQHQTFATGAEWRNVRSSEDYAQFLERGGYFFNFPFFKEILNFWKGTLANTRTALRYESFPKVFFNEYMMMDLFIGLFMSIEYLIKAMVYTPLSLFIKKEKEELSALDGYQITIAKDYANFIEKTPFYEYPYLSKIMGIFNALKQVWNSKRQSYSFVATLFSRTFFLELYTATALVVDLLVKGLIAKPVFYLMGKGSEYDNPTHALIQLPSKLNHFSSEILKDYLKGIDPRIEVIQQFRVTTKDNHNRILVHITIPHYRPFASVAKKLVAQDCEFIEIAGQKRIQMDIVTNAKDNTDLQEVHLSQESYPLDRTTIASDPLQKQRISWNMTLQDFNTTLRSRELLAEATAFPSILHVHDF